MYSILLFIAFISLINPIESLVKEEAIETLLSNELEKVFCREISDQETKNQPILIQESVDSCSILSSSSILLVTLLVTSILAYYDPQAFIHAGDIHMRYWSSVTNRLVHHAPPP